MIGERLKRARAASGLSMQGLGKAVGVSANMIKKYEHDLSMPSSGILIKISKALGVRSEYFFRPIQVALSGVEYRKACQYFAENSQTNRGRCIRSGRALAGAGKPLA